MDVALEVSVELGRSHMSIAEILALRQAASSSSDKLAGEPVDVSVNGTLIARGEVVVVDEKFGVRITEVVSKAQEASVCWLTSAAQTRCRGVSHGVRCRARAPSLAGSSSQRRFGSTRGARGQLRAALDRTGRIRRC